MIRTGAMIALWLGLVAWGHAESGDWYLVEFAANRPVCEDSARTNEQDAFQSSEETGQPTNGVPSASRCWETGSGKSTLELRDGEVIEMSTSGTLPPAWVALQQLWLYAPAMGSAGFRVSLNRTPSGVRLQLQEGSVSYLETLPLDTWVRLDHVNARQLWARISHSTVP